MLAPTRSFLSILLPIGALISAATVSSAHAQERGGWSTNRFRPALHGGAGFFGEGASTPDELAIHGFGMAHLSGLLKRDDTSVAKGLHGLANVALGVSFLEHFGLAVDVPFAFFGSDAFLMPGQKGEGLYLGDVRASVRGTFLGHDSAFGVGAVLDVIMPTAHEDFIGGESGLTWIPKLVLDYRDPDREYALWLNGWAVIRSSDNVPNTGVAGFPTGVFGRSPGSGMDLGALVGLGVALDGPSLQFIAEGRFETGPAEAGAAARMGLDAVAGLHYRDDSGIVFGVGGGAQVLDGYAGPDWHAFLTLGYQSTIDTAPSQPNGRGGGTKCKKVAEAEGALREAFESGDAQATVDRFFDYLPPEITGRTTSPDNCSRALHHTTIRTMCAARHLYEWLEDEASAAIIRDGLKRAGDAARGTEYSGFEVQACQDRSDQQQELASGVYARMRLARMTDAPVHLRALFLPVLCNNATMCYSKGLDEEIAWIEQQRNWYRVKVHLNVPSGGEKFAEEMERVFPWPFALAFTDGDSADRSYRVRPVYDRGLAYRPGTRTWRADKMEVEFRGHGQEFKTVFAENVDHMRSGEPTDGDWIHAMANAVAPWLTKYPEKWQFFVMRPVLLEKLESELANGDARIEALCKLALVGGGLKETERQELFEAGGPNPKAEFEVMRLANLRRDVKAID